MSANRGNVSVYDQLRDSMKVREIVDGLRIEVARETGAELCCRPLCHESESGESLHINTHAGTWLCRACNIGGDEIQLVEYALHGGMPPTKGQSQKHSETHREAVRWLCEMYMIDYSERSAEGDVALECVNLFAQFANEYLLNNCPEVVAWIQEQWGLDIATIEARRIGYMPSPVPPHIANIAVDFKHKGFGASGLGYYPGNGNYFQTSFSGRVTFPYLEHGRAVYLIGRKSPWLPKDASNQGKYYKLPVHSDKRKYISESITNDHLFNEQVMADNPESVVVAEGITDAIALSTLGVPVVSPVTVSINKHDIDRFVSKCDDFGIKRVEILFDNELSGSGTEGAMRTGRQLVERGLSVSILTLPLGEKEMVARDEVIRCIGEEAFAELEQADPRRRKEIIAESARDDAARNWVHEQVAASKIDAAEFIARTGAGAAGRIDAIRKAGRDMVQLEAELAAAGMDPQAPVTERIHLFRDAIQLAAHVDDSLIRSEHASVIAKLAGKGITKQEVSKRIVAARKKVVADRKAGAKVSAQAELNEPLLPLVPFPPEMPTPAPKVEVNTQTPLPVDPNAPAAPPPPGQAEKPKTEHEEFAPKRTAVLQRVKRSDPAEQVGQAIARIVAGPGVGRYTAFRTPMDLFLVKGDRCLRIGLDRYTPEAKDFISMASGLTTRKSSHGEYIHWLVYFLNQFAVKVDEEISWSCVRGNDIFFPTGGGSIAKVSPGKVERLPMTVCRVPAVVGEEFVPFHYTEESGIERAMRCFRWTSLSDGDQLILTYWLVCLPLLRRVGVAPIVRIEGGASSGKTRAVNAVSMLVNGQLTASVPTSPALATKLSKNILTIDDNRESDDVTPHMLSTLLQATGLGAREKRRGNSDTETVMERVCGALLMNGIEPIHQGKAELASRMLTLRCSAELRRPESPAADDALFSAILECRDAFWSESIRRCSVALALDLREGEEIGGQIEALFDVSRIGRLSRFLRMMYFAWVAGQPEELHGGFCEELAPVWVDAFNSIGALVVRSLIDEELVCTVLRYAFDFCQSEAEFSVEDQARVWKRNGKTMYVEDAASGAAQLGEMRARTLVRIVRDAAKDRNAPDAITRRLSPAPFEARLNDGIDIGLLARAGFEIERQMTTGGSWRFTFRRIGGGEASAGAAGVPDPMGGTPF